MASIHIAIVRTGLATAVGLSSPATCAAVRAKLSNPSPTRFICRQGKWLVAHQVTLSKPWVGRTRLTKLATTVIAEVLSHIDAAQWPALPLLLCVAEPERPGRLPGLDDQLMREIQQELGLSFAPGSAVVAQGRVAVAIALMRARALLADGAARVLVVAVDSFIHGPTLSHYERQGRVLTADNANGFLPGEGAGALLVARASGAAELVCHGIGLGLEPAHIDSGVPLRADGLSNAIKGALAEARCEMHDMDYRITDLSGEQYYFKEAALALTRTLRQRKHEFENWHPAECIGEAGALAGAAVLAVADMACRKRYSLGRNILAHMANDSGRRAALALHFTGA